MVWEFRFNFCFGPRLKSSIWTIIIIIIIIQLLLNNITEQEMSLKEIWNNLNSQVGISSEFGPRYETYEFHEAWKSKIHVTWATKLKLDIKKEEFLVFISNMTKMLLMKIMHLQCYDQRSD